MTHIIDLDKKFFFGGNATFTVESDSGEYRTYKIRRMDPNPRFPNQAYAVALLSGPDNENSYSYIGLIDPDTGHLRLTSKSRRTEFSPDVRIFRWAMRGVFHHGMRLNGGTIHHEGKCGCCGRTLTVPESIKRGIGPECWERLCS